MNASKQTLTMSEVSKNAFGECNKGTRISAIEKCSKERSGVKRRSEWKLTFSH